MKLGLGMHPERWSDAHLAMARQLGCETVVPWVPFGPGDGVWHEEQFAALKAQAERHGLELAAIENFHWEHIDHIVLGEEGRDEQLENLCRTIENAGRCGIPCFGYNFSCCGVQGYYAEVGNAAGRGLASLKCFDESKVDHAPQPNRKFWFKDEIARRSPEGFIPPVGEDEFWGRIRYFLDAVLPTAEKAGVKLCAHPEDPPIPFLKGTYRALHSVEGLRRLLALSPSPSNCLEFCQGTVSTMAGVDIYAAIEEFASSGRIGYVHFRNTSGTRPRYNEVFIDDGYVDMKRAMAIYERCGFDGTVIPDHTPRLTAADWWETGMAFALGYMRGIMRSGNGNDTNTK